MRKKILIIVITIFSFFVIVGIGLVVYYNDNLKSVDSESGKVIDFTVAQGSTSRQVIDQLYDKGLIKNKYVGYVYIKLNSDFILQAGNYELSTNMTLEQIIDKFNSGKVIDNSISVTFIEGERLIDYIAVIKKNFGYSEDEILNTLSDKEYLQELIDKYWFLTDDILNDKLYYALEGYLAPNTYFFNEDASIKEIIGRLLDANAMLLDKYKDEIENSGYTLHEIITMASIVEREGTTALDRKGVAGVWYNRLNNGWTLGSDVTTYYGVNKTFKEELLYVDLENCNPYNTSAKSKCAFAGLPVGPICNPSVTSIVATIEPEEHQYFYFVADKNGKTYFTTTFNEHVNIINKLKNEGLWFEYN